MASFNKNFRVNNNLDVLGTGTSSFAGPLTVTGTTTATTFSGSGASLTNIPNGALTNSSVTIGSSAVALGAALTTIIGLTSVTSTTFVGSLTGSASQLNGQAASYYLDLTNATGTLAVARLPALTGGDVTSSAGSSTLTIGAATVSLAKMANLAANSIMGNNTGSAATPLALTAAQVRTLLNVADGATANTGTVTAIGVTTANGVSGSSSGGATPNLTITLGAITPTSVAASGTVTGSNLSGTSSGTNTGDQTITLTGDVTGSGTGSFAATIGAGAVSLAKMANIATASLIGRSTAGSGVPEVISIGSGLSLSAGTLSATGGGGGMTWTTIPSGNVATAADNTGYIMETGGTTRTVTLPASVTMPFRISVNASGGSVRIVSNGNVIDGVGSGNDLLLADGNTASLVAKATGSLEIIYGGTSSVGNVPAGGTTGQVLKKTSGTDFDYTWGGFNLLYSEGDLPLSALGGGIGADSTTFWCGDGTWTTPTPANGSITLAKMANMATGSLIGRNTAGTGVPEVLTFSAVKSAMLLGAVENVALSTWAGSANITTVGDASGVTQAAGNNTTKLATTAYAMSAAPNSSYRTVLDSSGSHVAARVAGTYGLAQSQPAAITGTGTLYPLNIIYIDAADFPAVNGIASKLRIRAALFVNDVAPTGNYTIGLHPITRPATSGGAAVLIYTIGAAVAGSTVTVTAPAADSMNNAVGTDFAVPASGYYVIGFVTTATVATSSLVHISATLQHRNA